MQEKKYLCTQISVSWKEIEKFAKQISVYKSPNIILFALSTTDVSKEARYICVVASESCPIPSLITDNGTFFALAALAYNVGCGKVMKSRMYAKMRSGNRNIYRDYVDFKRWNGKIVPSIERRRKMEYLLLFTP